MASSDGKCTMLLPGSVRQALESKKAWAAWMQVSAKLLETTIYEDKEAHDVTCKVCNCSMVMVEAHLCGQRHYKNLWHCLHPHLSETNSSDNPLPSVEQVFEVSGIRITFDHLSGKICKERPSKVNALDLHEERSCKHLKLSKSGEKKPIMQGPSNDDDQCMQAVNLAGKTFTSKDGLVAHMFALQECYRQRECVVEIQDQFLLLGLLLAGKMQHMFRARVSGFRHGFHADAEEKSFILILADGSESPFDWGACVHSIFKSGPLVLPPCFEAVEVSSVVDNKVPLFDSSARGGPHEWNQYGVEVYWGKRTVNLFSRSATTVDLDSILTFLNVRLGPDGLPVLSRLGRPIPHEQGWFRLQWMQLTHPEMLELSAAGWQRAWHGCKLEGLYSILFHGRLLESCDEAAGERLLTGMPGVYAHKDATFRKAENYIRFVDLLGSGIFWAAKLELLVNRDDAVKAVRHTDQWAQPARSVRLAALWICGRLHRDMRAGDAVSLSWDPKREANPEDERWSRPQIHTCPSEQTGLSSVPKTLVNETMSEIGVRASSGTQKLAANQKERCFCQSCHCRLLLLRGQRRSFCYYCHPRSLLHRRVGKTGHRPAQRLLLLRTSNMKRLKKNKTHMYVPLHKSPSLSYAEAASSTLPAETPAGDKEKPDADIPAQLVLKPSSNDVSADAKQALAPSEKVAAKPLSDDVDRDAKQAITLSERVSDAVMAVNDLMPGGKEGGTLKAVDDSESSGDAPQKSVTDDTVKPVYLNGKKFSSKEELLQHIRRIQESVEQDGAHDDGNAGKLSSEHNLFIFHLLLHHPKAVEKRVNPISHFRYGTYDNFKNKCFIAVNCDGTQEGVSVGKSVNVVFPPAGKSVDGCAGLVVVAASSSNPEDRGTKRQREPPATEEKPRGFEPQEMVKGVVIDVHGLKQSVNYQKLKEQLNEFGRVRFLEFIKPEKTASKRPRKETAADKGEEGDVAEEEEEEELDEEPEEELMTARCRFCEPEGAAAAVAGLKKVDSESVEAVLLSGKEEEAFWENVNKKLKELFDNPNPKGRGKKGKKSQRKGKDSKDKAKGKSKGRGQKKEA